MSNAIQTPAEVNRLYKHLLVHEYAERIYNDDTIYIGILDRKRDATMCRDKAIVYIQTTNEWTFEALLNTDADRWSESEAKNIVYKMIKIHYPEQKEMYLSYKKSKQT